MAQKKVSFVPYPDPDQADFYSTIYRKKEFFKTKSPAHPSPDYLKTHLEAYRREACNPKQFTIQHYQEFVRNFLSTSTDYNGLLLFWGVGTGKCLTPEAQVYVNGQLIPIRQLWDQQDSGLVVPDTVMGETQGEWITVPLSQSIIINSYDATSDQIIEKTVSRLYRQKIAEPIRLITLANGSHVRLTQQHQLLTDQGWTNQLDTVHSVAIPRTLEHTSSVKSIGVDMAYFLGWHMSNGYESGDEGAMESGAGAGASQLMICNVDWEQSHQIIDFFTNLSRQYQLSHPIYHLEPCGHLWCLKLQSPGYQRVLTDGGYVWGCEMAQRQIPALLMNANAVEIRAFLRAYCYSKLWVDSVHHRVEITPLPCEMARGLSTLLKLFGIELQLKPEAATYVTGILYGHDLMTFYNEIGVWALEKNQEILSLLDVTHDQPMLDSQVIQQIPVTSITTEWYEGYVYDLEVPETHNFVANGIVCHNTCAAMQIAEGLKESVKKMDKMIYVITKKQLKDNFIKELYSKDREQQEKKGYVRGALQCVGDTYYTSPEEEPQLDARAKKSLNKIKQYYKFTAAQKFANDVDRVIRPALKEQGMTLGQYFSNCVFIIDEAHGLTSSSEDEEDDEDGDEDDHERSGKKKSASALSARKVSSLRPIDIMNEIFDDPLSKGNKLILLTATPMQDTADDICLLIDLLLRNDKRPNLDTHVPLEILQHYQSFLKKTDLQLREMKYSFRKLLFPEDNVVNEELLKQLTRGYVSYVRGEDPRSFPTIVDFTPDPRRYPGIETYAPKPRFDEEGHQLDTTQYISRIQVIRCPMSVYQFSQYLQVRESEQKTHEISSRQASNIIFPQGGYGKSAFAQSFVKETTESEQLTKTKRKSKANVIRYSYRDHTGFLKLDRVGQYSSKLEIFLRALIHSRGIAYVYTDFVEVGALLIALMLEENGYSRYGKTNLLKQTIDKGELRCAICGYLRREHERSERGSSNPEICRSFKEAKYVLFTGNNQLTETEKNVINHVDNKDGQNIKLIIGTRASGEGVDYKMIREVHIFDPWHNNTRLYQAIGRAARHCSHINLEEPDRHVTVFKYCSSPPKIELPPRGVVRLSQVVPEAPFTYQQALMETTDEKIYRRVERKDIFVKKIERVLKVGAVDCALNRNINMFHNALKNDVDGSRECDYMACDYQCEGFGPQGPDPQPEINTDTYNLYFSEPQIKKVEQYIIDLFTINFAMTLEIVTHEIQQRLPGIETVFIYEALDRILGHLPQKSPIILYDRFGRAGHLIYADPYYVFQPEELADPLAPMYYKMTPASRKRSHLAIKSLQGGPREVPETRPSPLDQPSVIQQVIGQMLALISQTTLPYMIYRVHAMMDRRSFVEQGQIFEQVSIAALQKTTGSMTLLGKELTRYYLKRGYVLQHESQTTGTLLSHRFNVDDLVSSAAVAASAATAVSGHGHFRILRQLEWVDVTTTDEIWLSPLFKSKVDTRVPDYLGVGVIGFVTYHANKNAYQFSLINYREERLQATKVKLQDLKKGRVAEPGVSKKSQKTGRVCTTCNLHGTLIPIAQQLGVIPTTTTTLPKEMMCQVIEWRLRELDYTANKKVFYHPDEKISRD